jgi:hypothetical protein
MRKSVKLGEEQRHAAERGELVQLKDLRAQRQQVAGQNQQDAARPDTVHDADTIPIGLRRAARGHDLPSWVRSHSAPRTWRIRKAASAMPAQPDV